MAVSGFTFACRHMFADFHLLGMLAVRNVVLNIPDTGGASISLYSFRIQFGITGEANVQKGKLVYTIYFQETPITVLLLVKLVHIILVIS